MKAYIAVVVRREFYYLGGDDGQNMKFADLGLGETLLKVVGECGYETPTAIQQQAIPKVLAGDDLLGSAQTGSGKTAGFALPLIEMLGRERSRHRMARALVLEPTRELAAQVLEDFTAYCVYHKLRSVLLTGGIKIDTQERALLKHMDVIIATPGRLLDIYERGRLLLPDIRYLVIDEADRMLDMGFIPDVEKIVKALPKNRQTLLFSATLDPQVKKIAAAFLRNPKTVNVTPPSTVAATVSHHLTKTAGAKKPSVLLQLIKENQAVGFDQGIVFCNRKRDIDRLVTSLKRGAMNAEALHGDMSQPRRTHTLELFRRGEVDILVASDVAARGLDIDTVSHVFNYDVPLTVEDYVHRIGRTGRAGRSGKATTIATAGEEEQLEAIQSQLAKNKTSFQEKSITVGAPRGVREERRGRGYREAYNKTGKGGRERREPRFGQKRATPPSPETMQKAPSGRGFSDGEVPGFLKISLTTPAK